MHCGQYTFKQKDLHLTMDSAAMAAKGLKLGYALGQGETKVLSEASLFSP